MLQYIRYKYIRKANFNLLNKLNLSHNDLSDINILEKVNFYELEELDLSWNQITDINILEKVNFKELKELDLRYNQIDEDKNNILFNLKSKLNIKI